MVLSGVLKPRLLILLILSSSINLVGAATPSVPDRVVDTLSLPDDSIDPLPELPAETHQPEPLQLPVLPKPSNQQLSSMLTIQVKHIRLRGNTVFNDDDLVHIISPYLNRAISSADLFDLRNLLTHFYIQAGYVNSGAVIPDQSVNGGILYIDIVEGTLNDILVAGDNWLQKSYIRDRLYIGNERVLNIQQLQQRIKVLQQDKLVERINAELTPAGQPGESLLKVRVEESRFFDFGVTFNNHRSPSIGEYQGEFNAAIHNVTGYGDALYGRFALTEGIDSYAAHYSIPLTAHDTRLRIYYDQNDANIIEQPFDLLAIQSINKNYGIELSQPIYFSPRNMLINSLTLERRKSTLTFQLPGSPREPFPSVTDDGKTELYAFRFRQEWRHRSTNHVIALRSTMNFGFDVTPLRVDNVQINKDHFFSWQGQFQWVQRIPHTDIQFLLRTNAQLSDENVLPMEKFSMGGARSVRGFRENQLVRDIGVTTSAEVRVPLFKLPLPWVHDAPSDGSVQLAAFYDFGWGEQNLETSSSIPEHISSVGLGLRWTPTPKIHSEIYYAFPLRNVEEAEEDSLQEQGLSFFVNVDLY